MHFKAKGREEYWYLSSRQLAARGCSSTPGGGGTSRCSFMGSMEVCFCERCPCRCCQPASVCSCGLGITIFPSALRVQGRHPTPGIKRALSTHRTPSRYALPSIALCHSLRAECHSAATFVTLHKHSLYQPLTSSPHPPDLRLAARILSHIPNKLQLRAILGGPHPHPADGVAVLRLVPVYHHLGCGRDTDRGTRVACRRIPTAPVPPHIADDGLGIFGPERGANPPARDT